jgi:hypothetical protein
VKKVVTPATDGEAAGFVTVHDYLSTLHPWLTGLKKDIIRAETVWERAFLRTRLSISTTLQCSP